MLSRLCGSSSAWALSRCFCICGFFLVETCKPLEHTASLGASHQKPGGPQVQAWVPGSLHGLPLHPGATSKWACQAEAHAGCGFRAEACWGQTGHTEPCSGT